jgi:iturin family lipopeptide synthetase A
MREELPMIDKNIETGLEIAVIGMAGRFPGAENIEAFWDNLTQGMESLSFLSEAELLENGLIPSALPHTRLVKTSGGLLEDIEYFDAAFFDYTPLEAEQMAPPTRIFHENLWELFEDAGYDPGCFNGTIGLYVGSSSTYTWITLCRLAAANKDLNSFVANYLSDRDYIGTLVSYKLNLKGPSYSMYTACSTSLVAIHLASQGLLGGDCDMAAAGGIAVSLAKRTGYFYTEGMILSEDGHCRAFDARAGGVIPGEGIGLVALKRLDDAKRHRDHIYAVIKGTAVNNDGSRKVGFAAPGVDGQASVIKKAMKMAGVNPGEIGYVETHGTATALGDVTEIEALKIAFNTDKKQYCAVGSVKTNVGHLDAAAGVTGFIKAVLALKHRQIPASIHYETPNPAIDFENSPFYVNRALKEWQNEGNGKPRRAGVSSFGIGGTNAHVILEEALDSSEGTGGLAPLSNRHLQLILLSAKTETALDRMTQNLAHHLQKHPGQDLADVAYTLQVGRRRHSYRRKVVCADGMEAIRRLTTREPREVQTYHAKTAEGNKPVIFMFPGLGSQYVDMGRGLYETEPVFRQEMDRCCEILAPLLDYDIKKILYPGTDQSDQSDLSDLSNLPDIDIAQLSVFIFEYALARLLITWGIKPRAMIGYSFGEYAAACISGIFSLEEALELVAARGRLLKGQPTGMMLGVPLPVQEVESFLTGPLAIGIDNGESCVVSGPAEAVAAFEKQMQEKKLLCMRLETRHGIHSSMMDPVLPGFAEKLRTLHSHLPRIPFISTVTGSWITPGEAQSPEYWVNQLRRTVQFSRGIETLLAEPASVFIEVGPGREISALVKRQMESSTDKKHQVVNLVRHPKKEIPDAYFLLDKIGLLWLYGVSVDWEQYHSRPEAKRYRTSLPTYPFDKYRFWKLVEEYESGRLAGGDWEAGKSKTRGKADWFYVPTWKRQNLFTPSAAPGGNETSSPGWLVFMDDYGIGERLVEQLQKQTGKLLPSPLITVKIGPGYSVKSEAGYVEYTINPRQQAEYETLFKNLRPGAVPGRIVHLWGVSSDRDRPEGTQLECIEKEQELGFYSLLYLAQALGQKGAYTGQIDIHVVTTDMQEVTGAEKLHPGKATVLGPCRVIPQEYPGISCKSIDLTATQLRDEAFIPQLLGEITHPREDIFPEVAYRGNRRWVKSFEPLHLDELPTSSDPSRLRSGGVYWIIGGLGDIGYTLAQYLVKQLGARLILTGRTPLPPREMWNQYMIMGDKEEKTYRYIQRLLKLEELGGKVYYSGVDAADRKGMQAALREGEERLGSINGVIHAAGIIRGDSFKSISAVGIYEGQEQFRTKLYGLSVVEEVLRDKALDFGMMISSISTVLGGLGFVAYSAANHFLDAFSIRHNQERKQKRDGRWIIVDWDGTNAEDTADAMRRILFHDTLEHVIFSVGGDLEERIARWVKLQGMEMHREDKAKEGKSAALYSRPELSNPYTSPRDSTEQKLADIWQHFFGIDKIGVTDDLFDLGADSLKMINIIAIIQKELKVTIPIKEFFDHPTIESTARYINHAEEEEFLSIPPVEEKEYYALSSAQKRLYILQEMEKTNTAYNSPQVLLLEGLFTPDHLEQAVQKLIERHESLRTSIVLMKLEPVQRVHRAREVPPAVDYYDLIPEKEAGPLPARVETLIKDFIRPFDLSRVPFFRIKLLKIEENRYVFMFDIHHIVTDGVTHEIFVRELLALYIGANLNLLPIQYKDYSEWQRSPRQQQRLAHQEAYWLSQFQTGDEIPVLVLPYDYPRPVLQSFAGDVLVSRLSEEETQALRKIATQENMTLYMVLMAIFNVFLLKLSGQEDIVVGTPVAGRRHVELEPIIGVFINTLPIRNYPCGEKTWHVFLQEVKQVTLQAYENQDYQFEDLVDKLVIRRDTGRNPLFDAVFVLQISPTRPIDQIEGLPPLEKTGLRLKQYHTQQARTSKFDLTLNAGEEGKGMLMLFEYCTRLFKRETVERFIHYFKQITAAVTADRDRQQHISRIDILPEEEKSRLLEAFGQVEAKYPAHKSLFQLFAEQVDRNPDRISVIGKSTKQTAPGGGTYNQTLLTLHHALTYKELNRQANHLACRLKESGIKSDSIVAIMAERSIETIIGIMGILATGGAYLSIDPDYPEERINYMLADSAAKVLVAAGNLAKEGEKMRRWEEEKNLEVVFLETLSSSSIRTSDPPGILASQPPRFHRLPAISLAYIIYTSGTTGKPKGGMIENVNVVRLMFNDRFQFDFNERDTWTLFHSFCFDFSVWEMYGALLYGGRLIVIPREIILDPSWFLKIIKTHGVSVLNQTPSAFYNLINEELKEESKDLKLRYVIFGGEALKPGILKEWYRRYPHTRLINMFGITETTVHVTYKEIGNEEIASERSNIGSPIPTLCVYMLDRFLRLIPIGAAGELCVGGAGVARGYLNHPELTAQRFVENPFKPPEWLYKSGDLGRLLENGDIEYLGRIDQQVKIRGFRIELGEIESRLMKHPNVKEVVVVIKKMNEMIGDVDNRADKHLCAYFVSDKELTLTELRVYLSRQLPDYMIPSSFVRLEKIPLTSNGKVDKKSLEVLGKQLTLDSVRVPPRSEIEKKLAGIWSELLQVDEVGIHDNFFDLGGNSMGVILLSNKLKEALNTDIPVAAFYRYVTIHSFVQYLTEEEVSSHYFEQKIDRTEELKDRKSRLKKRADQMGGSHE